MDKKAFALELYNIGAFQTKDRSPDGKGFSLKAHSRNPELPLSPFYLNLRTITHAKNGPLGEYHIAQIVELMHEVALSHRLRYHCVVGVPDAATEFAEAYVRARRRWGQELDFIQLAKAPTENKFGYSINLMLTPLYGYSRTLVLDDVLTAADTKLQTIRVLETYGIEVGGIVVLVDRDQGGRRVLIEAGYPIVSIYTIWELIDLYLEVGLISQELFEEIERYLKIPAT
ncbi:hypothetical protein HYW32_00530 [Candidatus Berkelbacteria bacterium]|nr:hypothetical protein [Candidatus Berkelbacteria bacterium]